MSTLTRGILFPATGILLGLALVFELLDGRRTTGPRMENAAVWSRAVFLVVGFVTVVFDVVAGR